MEKEPLYKSVPTFNDYEMLVLETEYVKGWNDAMDFIFPEQAKERKREKAKAKLRASIVT